jgi:A/G-specific adenine glycosylase
MILIDCIFEGMNFQNEIINWYKINKRELPWRNTTDAYIIWLSEIILQQTRVEQGLPYFNKFLANFPTVGSFADATENQVLKLWQGLGYYSRGRNMLYTAKQVVEQHKGTFPMAYNELIKLKGIGEYTAAAISSFANNESQAVLDGNVFRVLARYFGIEEPINSTKGKKIFTALAQHLIVDQPPAIYNQAIMEFGALQCKPKSPLCNSCPLQIGCTAFKTKKVDVLPVKLKKVKVKERWFNYFVCKTDKNIAIKQRKPGDIWQQLYDFPLIETTATLTYENENFSSEVKKMFGEQVIIAPIMQKKHLLTHQIIYVQFFGLDNYMINFNLHNDIKLVTLAEFKALPHPKVIGDFIEMYLEN